MALMSADMKAIFFTCLSCAPADVIVRATHCPLLALFGCIWPPYNYCRCLLFLYFRIMIRESGPSSRNFISRGTSCSPGSTQPSLIMGSQSVFKGLLPFPLLPLAAVVFFFLFFYSPFGLYFYSKSSAVTPFSTVLRHLADRYWLLDKYTLLRKSPI